MGDTQHLSRKCSSLTQKFCKKSKYSLRPLELSADARDGSGISATNDSVYYNFLLKVGVIKAPTWGDKWDLWRGIRLDQTSPSSPSASLITQGGSSNRRSQQSFASSQLPEVRRRVPFLASASSDLDEGYTGGEESEPSIRASPRVKVAKEGIADYTPTETVDVTGEDSLSFDPPIRTSTPVFAQYPRSGYLPDYTPSDVSQDLEQTIEGFSAVDLSTPRAQTKQTLQTVSWVDRIDDLPPDVKNQMEQKADTFYAYGLTWRCWNMWFKTSEWYRVSRPLFCFLARLTLHRSLIRISSPQETTFCFAKCWRDGISHHAASYRSLRLLINIVDGISSRPR